MKVSELCVLQTVIILKHEKVKDAAQLMKKYNVGTVVVVESDDKGNTPIGIVSDRDIVMRVTASDKWNENTLIEEVMSKNLLTMHEDTDVYDALKRMRYEGVRRVPVVNEFGYLLGILALDDILSFLTAEMNEVIELIAKEEPLEVV